jgi:hypothetical protein
MQGVTGSNPLTPPIPPLITLLINESFSGEYRLATMGDAVPLSRSDGVDWPWQLTRADALRQPKLKTTVTVVDTVLRMVVVS